MDEDIIRRLFIVTAPSGAGKTTLVSEVIAKTRTGNRVITSTSRLPEVRDGKQEIDGEDYHFFSHEDFKARVALDEFAEYEEVFAGRWYGTLKSALVDATRDGGPAYLVCDVNGAKKWIALFPTLRSRAVFLDVPEKEMRMRLKKRGCEGAALKTRINRFTLESAQRVAFDNVLMNKNGELERAVRFFIKFVALRMPNNKPL